MTIRARKTIIIAGGSILLIVVAGAVYLSWLDRRLEAERVKLAAQAVIEVEAVRLRAPASEGIKYYLNAADTRAIERFRDVQYLATSGGLIALDSGGAVVRKYTTLEGLPDNDLTALAVFRERLFIGAAHGGLVSFDGDEFTYYRIKKPIASRVNVLLATDSALLVGTMDGGLIAYDGDRFFRPLAHAPARVTALLASGSRLYMGTQDRGLYISVEGRIDQVAVEQGLPSPRVTGLAEMPPRDSKNGRVAVATDFGVVALNDDNQVIPISAKPNVTSIAVSKGKLWAGLFNGGVLDLSGGAGSRGRSPASTRSAQTPTTVCAKDGVLWALTVEGAFEVEEGPAGPLLRPFGRSLTSERAMSGNHVTGMALDGGARLWVGYFDGGIDVLSTETDEVLTHLDDERLRQINFMLYDSRNRRILAATSRGLISIGGGAKPATVIGSALTRESAGLVDNSIAHISMADAASSVSSDRVIIATAGGLTELANGRARSITAFHGLPSNHLYCSLQAGSRTFIGSLAGLIELDGLRVAHIYRTSNSPLSHDWVTALAEVAGSLYVGTNGGGVDALLPTGEWVSFANEIGRLEVSQNAMRYDSEKLYVGSAGRGLLVHDLRNRRWSRVEQGLTSMNVTAVVSDDRYIFLGTANGVTRIEKRSLD